ncbi:gf17261, related [Neospora caninum Liverpool]|uniref:Gf17261, related n=1 Tax=Neospora caninum (strain Liverpool) TaxID=572307 RepID=F0V962_NEOCL|nr:gf17261, related [Neospora caninum Liverpool]CBZ50287.1 gf17261, related [Neospora caninum Liverpool]|eukprot:XP_003880321.1 gf17261, related [Neospora caninum Liverpool]
MARAPNRAEKVDTMTPDGETLAFVDIGANLTDEMYQGVYFGKTKHGADLERVIDRARHAGCKKLLVTGGSLSDSEKAIELCRKFEVGSLGVYSDEHGAALLSFRPPAHAVEHLNKLVSLIERNRDRVAAIGELGLDADRTQFCDLETQKKYFELQLLLSRHFRLPLFLHMRDAETSFCEILGHTRDLWEAQGGVVHSFTDSEEALTRVLNLSPSLHIGINGCSLKTEENLQVVKSVPLERLHLETDAPWCDIRPTHAGFAILKDDLPTIAEEEKKKQKPQNWTPETQIKNRNEPCNIQHVARIVRQLVAPDVPFPAFTQIVCANSLRMFPLMAGK